MRIPFDSLTLNAVVHELKPFVGAKVQKIVQPDANTIVLGMYGPGEGHLLISTDPVFARAHFVTKRYRNPQSVIGFCTHLRTHLDGAIVTKVRQVGFDRILEIDFESETGRKRIVAELMGKHSNLMLLGPDLRIIACAKAVGAGKSHRLILPGREYTLPPFPPRRPLFEALPTDDLTQFEGASPFLVSLIEAKFTSLEDLKERVAKGAFNPVLIRGSGAYSASFAR